MIQYITFMTPQLKHVKSLFSYCQVQFPMRPPQPSCNQGDKRHVLCEESRGQTDAVP